ncbi:MAG: WD40 repeat domain-containing protein [Nostoc sp.]|uniref:WD40 repeat domain-containing protein n=1 Tax=Nostoc sp. TaxID=1180 RepID=UPI002FFC2BB8
MQSFPEPEIQKILADAVQSKSEIPRLQPITASLTSPGGNLVRILTGHNDSVNAVAIAPDGQTAVSASVDNTLKLWDLETGKEISTLRGHKDSVNTVVITPDGQTAVSASSDNTLKLWDLETGKEISTLRGHNDSVNAVVITPNGQTAISVSNSLELWTLKLWDLETKREISTLRGHKDSVNAVVITRTYAKTLLNSHSSVTSVSSVVRFPLPVRKS